MKKGLICGTTCMKKSRTYMFQGLTVTLVSHLLHLPHLPHLLHMPYVIVCPASSVCRHTYSVCGGCNTYSVWAEEEEWNIHVSRVPSACCHTYSLSSSCHSLLQCVAVGCSGLQWVAVCYFAILVTHIPYVVVVRQTWDAAVWA